MLIACSSKADEPKDVRLELAIQDGKVNVDEGVIRVKQGDNVTFRITSDQAGGFHLHGYNFVMDVGPDEIKEMKFEADATGRFIIKLHPFGIEHSEPKISMKVDDAMDDHEDEEITLAIFEVLPR